MTPAELLRQALVEDQFPEDTDTNRLFTPQGEDGLRLNRNIALSAWMSQVAGRNINAGGATWQGEKDALARGFFKMPTARNVSDQEIHGLVRSHIKTQEEAATLAADAALMGQSLPDAIAELNASRGASPVRGIWAQYTKDLMRRHTAVASKLIPYRPLVDELASELGKEMSENNIPSSDKFQSVAERLLSVPEADRRLVIQAIGATGGATSEDRKSYLSKLAGTMGRMTEQIGAGAASAMETATAIETETSLREAGQFEFAGKMEAYHEKRRAFRLLTQTIRDVADRDVSPIKSDTWYGQLGIDVARMIPQSAVPLVNPALGFASNWAYFQDTIAAQAMQEDPRLTLKDADAVAAVAAPLSAAAETVTALIPFGKVPLPGLQKWLMAATSSVGGTARKMAVRAAAGTASEIGEEYAQAYLPLKTQELMAALKTDMPDVDWEKRMPKFSEIAQETWGPALIFSLVGAGSASIAEIGQGRALASDRDLLVAQGMNPSMADQIATAAEAGDWKKADGLFREEFVSDKKATEQERTQAIANFRQRAKAQEATEQEAEAKGIRVTRDQEGWKVTLDNGQTVKADTAEAARRMQQDMLMAATEYEASSLAAVVDDLVSGTENLRMEVSGEEVTADKNSFTYTNPITGKQRTIKDAASLQSLRNEALALSQQEGEQDVASLILGDNYFEMAQGVSRIFQRQGIQGTKQASVAPVITAIHEAVENSFRRGLLTGQFSDQGTQQALQSLSAALEPIRRQKLPDGEKAWMDRLDRAAKGEGGPDLMREVVSEMAVRTWIGRDRDGKKSKIRAGNILRALDSAVLSARKPEQVSTFKRLRAWFKAVGAYLRGVVATAKLIRDAEKKEAAKDFTAFMDKLLGITEAQREDKATAEEIQRGVAGIPITETSAEKLQAIQEKRPITLYHGSPKAGLTSIAKNSSWTTSRQLAQKYAGAGGKVYETRAVIPESNPAYETALNWDANPDDFFKRPNEIKLPNQIDVDGKAFSLSAGDTAETLISRVEQLLPDNPELALTVRQRAIQNLARLRDNWTKDRWTWDGENIRPVVEKRSKASLDKEQAFRQASLEGQRIAAGMEAIEARKQAREEAQEWREEQDQMQKDDWSPRESLLRDARLLNAALAVFPSDIRAKITGGGLVKLIGIATEKKRVEAMQKVLERAAKELERFMSKDLNARVKKLFDRFRPETAAGEKPKGKLGADVQDLVDAAEAAMQYSADATNAELARLDALLAADSLTPEEEVKLMRQRELVELFGDWANATSGRKAAALKALEQTTSDGWAKFKEQQLKKAERRAQVRDELRKASNKTGKRIERALKAKADAGILGKLKGSLLSLSSFPEFMSELFGESQTALDLVDRERDASNQYEDDMQATGDSLSDLFTMLGNGSVMRGEQIHYNLAKPTIETEEGIFSELQAITALLMWQQPDGRRHMEGPLDETGKPAGEWHYGQELMDKLSAALSDNGKAVLTWLREQYAAEYAPLNALYRARHGVSLPSNPDYAPLVVKPMQESKQADVADPLTGAMATGGIISPGFLKNRSSSAIAEPDFKDAIHVFMAHKRMLNYWSAYYDLATDLKATFGNRDVRNVVQAKAGEGGLKLMSKWLDYFATGGIRDAAAGLTLTDWQKGAMSRGSQVAILGRMTVLFVQATQMAAASVKMPTGAYLMRLSKLVSGNLNWGDAIRSDFIQRRFKTGSPLLQQALKDVGEAKNTNAIKYAVRRLGKELPGQAVSGADALFTAGTYAILLDYHRTEGAKAGLTGDDLEGYAHNMAERDTEAVAQPTRGATRSMAELTAQHPLSRMVWAFMSEARQKLTLAAWAAARFQTNRSAGNAAYFAKVSFLTFVVGGVLPQIIKNLWREAKGDDDEEKWSAARLAQNALTQPFAGVPGVSAAMDTGGGFMSSLRRSGSSLEDLLEGGGDTEEVMQDVDTLLSALGLFSDNAAALAVLSHMANDAAKIVNAASDE